MFNWGFFLLLCFHFFCLSHQAFAQQTPAKSSGSSAGSPTDSKNSQATFGFTGETRLLTNFVHKGLTQTEKYPSFQTAYWFNFGPQFRFGVWGSNVNYEGLSSHLWLRFNADVNITFSPRAQLNIKLSDNKFYAGSSRNGNTIGLNLEVMGYRTLFEMDSNWEGTETASNYFGFGKKTLLFGEWIWENMVGYSMLRTTNYSNFFDLRSSFGNYTKNFEYFTTLTWTSSPSQFNGRGDLFLIFHVGVNF